MGTLVLNGATSGSTTLQPTDATTQTITLPANSGTVITTQSTGKVIPTAALPAGTVLQVVSANYATETSTTSTSFVSTPLTASITPTSATSKIYVIASYSCYTSDNAKYTIYRNSTNLASGASTNGMGNLRSQALDSEQWLTYLDSPATTSATSYTIYMKSYSTGSTYIAVNNYTCTITLMEIAA